MAGEDDDRPSGVDASNWRKRPFHRWAFHHVQDILPVADIAGADDPKPLPATLRSFDNFELTFPNGASLPSVLKSTATDALVILRDGRVVFEAYDNGTTDQTPHILMSVTKAMTGLLVGILSGEGVLDVDASVSTYVPEVEGGAYRGATVRNLLDMRTGVTLDEAQSRDYGAALNGDGAARGLHAVLAGLTAPPAAHGGPFSYISANTDLLGWVIERATGRSFAGLFSERLWKPMAAERGATIIVDGEGSPWCSGGLCVTPRDFARVGDLLVNDGRRGADEIVPKAWIDDLCDNGDREAWATGEWRASFASIAKTMSYRAGWYAVHDDPNLLFAMGTHGQNLFIDRANRVVIAKLSSQANRIDPRAIGLTHMAVPELIRCALAGG